MAINVDGIPDELKKLNQWVLWKLEKKDGKLTKVPYQTNGYGADKTKPSNWTTFQNVIRVFGYGGYNGIGFIFTEQDQYCGIDFDHCVDPDTKEIEGWVKEKLKTLNSYTEYSQSGLGFHVFVKGKIPEHIKAGNKAGKADKKKGFEIYDQAWYFCMSGNVLNGSLSIEERQAEIEQICNEIFGKTESKELPKREPSTSNLSDSEIINIIRKSKQSDKFSKLFDHGDCSDYLKSDGTPDQSSGDMALADILVGYTKDRNQLLSIIKQSALYDDKWEREDYQRRTFDKALSGSSWQYNPGGNHGSNDKSNKAGNPVTEETKAETMASGDQESETKSNDPYRYFIETTFIPSILAEELMSEYDFICVDGILYIYLNGVYKSIGDDYVESESYKRLKHKAKSSRVSEIPKYIKGMCRTDSVLLNTHKFLINLNNGMYDITNEKLLSHSKDYLSTIRIPVNYNPGADNSIISDWLESTLIEPDCIQLACELFGYCLIADTAMAKAFMLVGSGANGKSTFITMLENFIGQDNVSKIPLQELSDHRFKRAELFGKLVNLFADLDNRALESTSYFKTIVTGDSIDAERKNQNPFSFRPYARLVFSANEIPRASDRTYAYYRRWSIITFDKKFEGVNDKKGLADELSKPENLSAMLNCALSGLKSVMKRQSFTEPKKAKDALDDYIKQNDPVKAFVDDCCEFDPDSRAERGSLYIAFCRYCDNNEFGTVTNKAFYARMRILKGVNELTDNEGKRVFTGIKLITS